MFFYYEKDGKLLASLTVRPGLIPAEPHPGTPVYFLTDRDPVTGRGCFKAGHPGQLAEPDGLSVLDASRLPGFPLDPALSAALGAGMLTVVNTSRPGWERMLKAPHTGKKTRKHPCHRRCGPAMLTGLKLLGGDVISRIGICDISEQNLLRWEFEMGQVSLPWNYEALPEVVIVPKWMVPATPDPISVISRTAPSTMPRICSTRL